MYGEFDYENAAAKLLHFYLSASPDRSDFFCPFHLNYFIICIISLIVFYSSDNSLLINSLFRPLFMNSFFNVVFALWFILLCFSPLYLEFLSKINEYLVFFHFHKFSLSLLFWKKTQNNNSLSFSPLQKYPFYFNTRTSL